MVWAIFVTLGKVIVKIMCQECPNYSRLDFIKFEWASRSLENYLRYMLYEHKPDVNGLWFISLC